MKRGHLLGRAWPVYHDNSVNQCSPADNARKNRCEKPRPTLKLLAIYVAIPFLVVFDVVVTLHDLRCFVRDRMIYLNFNYYYYYFFIIEICSFRSVLFLNDV